jgi:histone-lysine N-methyltransferase SETMAR
VPACITVDIPCLLTHRHVSGYNWTVHGWRQALDYEGTEHGGSGSTVVQNLQQDLKVHKIAAKWVPHHLSEVQQWTCYETCCISLDSFQHGADSMVNWIISTVETWERTFESAVTTEHKVWQKLAPIKLLIILEYDVYSVLVCYPIPQGETVSVQYYKSVLCYHLHYTFKENHPGLGQNAIIIPDDATAHVADTA